MEVKAYTKYTNVAPQGEKVARAIQGRNAGEAPVLSTIPVINALSGC